DTRELYFWDRTGRLVRKAANPTANRYQDMKFAGSQLVASGLLPDGSGAIDWLEYPSLRLLRRGGVGRASRGSADPQRGVGVRGNRVFLLPEDGPSRLFEFLIPIARE